MTRLRVVGICPAGIALAQRVELALAIRYCAAQSQFVTRMAEKRD